MIWLILALLVPSTRTVRLTADDSPCLADRERLCPTTTKNEFSILLCLQKEAGSDASAITEDCHHALWTFKHDTMNGNRFQEQMRTQCPAQIEELCTDKVDVISCMLEFRLDIDTSVDGGKCSRYLKSMAQIFFSDYHIVKGFLASCSDDVARLKCGTVTVEFDKDETPNSQARVISCLEKRIGDVSEGCRSVLTIKEELAADSFQLDRSLYNSCMEDKNQLCREIPDNAGAVYVCLGMYKFDTRMSDLCRQEVVRRQLMTLEDYKIDYGLKNSCGADLVTQQCLETRHAGRLEEGFMRTVLLLQCLSEAHEIQSNNRVPVSPHCIKEVNQVKRMIMGDIELTPSLGLACHNDVKTHCTNVRKNQEAGVINCLLELVGKDTVSLEDDCEDHLLDFIEVVDPISDYKLNYALMQNCGDFIEQSCKMEEGEGEVMNCLIKLELDVQLPDECHYQILSYKYFMSRSIFLDKPLLHACRADAESLCKTQFDEVAGHDSKPHGAVISCLYHHIFMEETQYQLSKECSPELKRAIIAQGESVNLAPRIVSRCAGDLVKYCNGFEENKDDYGCLQRHLISPTESLSEECAKEMELYAQIVSEDVRNDYRLIKACSEVIHGACKREYSSDRHADLLGCLVKEKDSLKGSCKRHVKDLELVSLYDFKFNKDFVEACNTDVQEHCRNRIDPKTGKKISKKQDVMYCLREQITKHKTQGETGISKECKTQLRQEFMKQMSDLDLDPALLAACSLNLKNTCKLDTMTDKRQVMECLRKNEPDLTSECRMRVFERELQQAEDPGIDPVLQESCSDVIRLYCPKSPGEEVLQCLENHLHKSGMTDSCSGVVKSRMKKEHSNYKLNIGLKKACVTDIKMLCSNVLSKIQSGSIEDGQGAIISCLKDNFNKISVECEDHMTMVLEQEVADFSLDPVLSRFCEGDIKDLCPEAKEDQVEACLRDHIMQVKSEDCTKQVVRLITESHGDIHLDPVLLRSCQRDIGYLCGRIVPGKGQIIDCLQSNEQRDKNSLTPTCSSMLKSRVTMWQNAYDKAKQYDSALEMVDDLYRAVESSQHKHELLAYLVMAVGLLIFISFCGGRCTKRPKPAAKLY